MTATHAEHLLELVARWGVTPAQLLEGLPVDEAAIRAPKARVPVSVLSQLFERAKLLTGEPGIGFYVGLSMRASSHGYVGFAALASATLGDAVDVAARFMPTRTNAIALKRHVHGGLAAVVVEEVAPLAPANDVMIVSLIVGLQAVGEAITGKRIEGSVDFALPEPAYIDRFRHVVHGGMRFGQPVHQIVFDAALLDLPLVMADKSALSLAQEQCERDLAELGYGGGAQVSKRLRALMNQRDPGFPSLEEAAKSLGFSTRTLKRRLDEEGSGFSMILDEQRRARALLLLRSPELSIEAVSERVGYSDLANFTRAFRKWTGMTPTAFRKNGRERRASA